MFGEKIYKMQHFEGSGTPVLYIGHTVIKGLWHVEDDVSRFSNTFLWMYLATLGFCQRTFPLLLMTTASWLNKL
jgi:hypothetical protein